MSGPVIRERKKGVPATTEKEASTVKLHEEKRGKGRPPLGPDEEPKKGKIFNLPVSLIQKVKKAADEKFYGNESMFVRDVLEDYFKKQEDSGQNK